MHGDIPPLSIFYDDVHMHMFGFTVIYSRCFRIVEISTYFLSNIRLYVCLSACTCISVTHTRRIFVKFDIGDFYENLSRELKFG